MVQAIKRNIALFISALLLAFAAVALPATANAYTVDSDGQAGCGTNINLSGSGDCGVTQGRNTVQQTIRNIINIFSIIVGAVAVIMIIFGGFRYITSGGDSNNIGSAKNTILYAIVGLVIVAIAQAVVQFVLNDAVT